MTEQAVNIREKALAAYQERRALAEERHQEQAERDRTRLDRHLQDVFGLGIDAFEAQGIKLKMEGNILVMEGECPSCKVITWSAPFDSSWTGLGSMLEDFIAGWPHECIYDIAQEERGDTTTEALHAIVEELQKLTQVIGEQSLSPISTSDEVWTIGVGSVDTTAKELHAIVEELRLLREVLSRPDLWILEME
jgi:hypothetical protein